MINIMSTSVNIAIKIKTNMQKNMAMVLFIYHNILDANRPAAWSKILAIQNHLKNYDWIFWSDADRTGISCLFTIG